MDLNGNRVVTPTPYAETSYKGKADPYYRENIAPPEDRKRHLAKGQCKLGVFPRVKITGICWDDNQELPYIEYEENKPANGYYNFYTAPEELRLPLKSLSQNTKEAIYLGWLYLHVGAMVILPLYLLISLVAGGWSDFVNNLDVLAIGVMGLLFSKYYFVYLIS